MATTPQQVISDALVVLGITFPGQVPSPSMLTDSFTRLNTMLASWAVERLLVYGILRATYNLLGGTNSYTIGPAGTFATARPNSIERANIIVAGLGVRSPLKLVTTDEWSRIVDQTATSSVPEVLYDDYEYPNSNLLFWPTPNANATQVELFTWQQLEQFVTLADSFDMPPGYQIAVTYGLAMVLSMVYGRPMTQEAMQVAMDSKNNLKSVNAPPTHVSGMGEEAIARGQILQGAGPMAGDAVMPVKR